MCVDAANCDGSCPECMSNKIRRLKMANKKLTKMCDQYLAELAAERQRARLPDELVEQLEIEVAFLSARNEGPDQRPLQVIRDILAWVNDRAGEQEGGQ